MRISVYIIVFLLCSFLGFGQDISHKSVSIKSNFSTEAVKVYQESADLKLEDFYQYLSLFSDKNSSEELKVEIRKNIFRLTDDQNIKVKDFTSNSNETISIPELLEKIKNNNYIFEISNIKNFPADFNFWTVQYQLKITNGNAIVIKNCNQKVFFTPKQKSFGSTQKEVWTIFLGNIF